MNQRAAAAATTTISSTIIIALWQFTMSLKHYHSIHSDNCVILACDLKKTCIGEVLHSRLGNRMLFGCVPDHDKW